MKTKLFITLALFVTVFAACKKDKNDTTPEPGTPETDYQPLTAGSTWQYNSSTSGAYTETATNNDSTIEGETYRAVDNSENGRRYINKNGGVYKAYGYVQEIDQYLKMTYLKDAAAGATWQESVNYTYSGFTVPVTFQYIIVSRDSDKIVNNVTYKNVIAVDITISANSPLVGGNVTLATGRQFYAKGVGTISSSLNFDALNTTVNDSTYLVAYDIK